MIEIGRLAELYKANHYPKEVQEKILEAVEIFTDEYGEDRDYKVKGGYVAIVESLDDFREFSQFNLDFFMGDVITEYQDILANGEYTSSLILLGDNYSLLVITPKAFSTFEKLKKMINDI